MKLATDKTSIIVNLSKQEYESLLNGLEKINLTGLYLHFDNIKENDIIKMKYNNENKIFHGKIEEKKGSSIIFLKVRVYDNIKDQKFG